MRVDVTSLGPRCLKIVALTAVSIACACGDSITPPPGLALLVPTLQVEPQTVMAGDTFDVRVAVENPTSDTVWIGSGNSTWVEFSILRNGERLPFQGTSFFYQDVISYFPIAPRDSLTAGWTVVALLQQDHKPFAYVVPPPPGQYVVHVWVKDVAMLESVLTVVPPAQASVVSEAEPGTHSS